MARRNMVSRWSDNGRISTSAALPAVTLVATSGGRSGEVGRRSWWSEEMGAGGTSERERDTGMRGGKGVDPSLLDEPENVAPALTYLFFHD